MIMIRFNLISEVAKANDKTKEIATKKALASNPFISENVTLDGILINSEYELSIQFTV